MAETSDERLVVLLEARVSEFERRMRGAERTGTGSYRRMRSGSRTATQQMERDMIRSTSRINQALATTSTRVGSFAKSFAAGLAGGAITAAFAAISSGLNTTINSMAQLGDEAKRAGMQIEEFQEWKFVADQNRIGVDALVDSFKEMSLRADEFVQTGSGSAAESFKRLGMSSADVARALKNPSEMMLELIGRMEDLDKAAQIRVADELFGGTGGERFVELLAQGEKGIRGTIASAREAGAVLDAEMIEKAQEIDRKFSQLSSRLGGWLKMLAVGLADLPFDMVETRLDELFGSEAAARSILGDGAVEELKKLGALTDEQVTSVEQLRGVYMGLGEDARRMAMELAGAASTADMLGNDALWEVLAGSSRDMLALADAFAEGTIEGDTFAEKLTEIQSNAANALSELDAIDQQGFAGVISNLSALGDSILALIPKAIALRNNLPGAPAATSGRGDGMAEAEAWRQRAAEQNAPTSLAPTESDRPRAAPALLGETGDIINTGGRSGGGGGGQKGNSRLDSLVFELQTEEEILTEWYSKSLELLNGATEAQLEALGGKHEAIERLQSEHKDRMLAIDEAKDRVSLQGILGAGADMLGAIGSTNQKALKISQGFAAAEAWVSTYKGAAKELEKGTFGFTSAMAVIGKGAAFVAAIKGVNGGGAASASGGGGSSGGSAQATSAPEAPLRVTLSGLRPSEMHTSESIIKMFDLMQKEAGNRGIIWVPN